jgi:hypothetical protein
MGEEEDWGERGALGEGHEAMGLPGHCRGVSSFVPLTPNAPHIHRTIHTRHHPTMCMYQVRSGTHYDQIISRFKKSLDGQLRTRLEIKASVQTLGKSGVPRDKILRAINVRCDRVCGVWGCVCKAHAVPRVWLG